MKKIFTLLVAVLSAAGVMAQSDTLNVPVSGKSYLIETGCQEAPAGDKKAGNGVYMKLGTKADYSIDDGARVSGTKIFYSDFKSIMTFTFTQNPETSKWTITSSGNNGTVYTLYFGQDNYLHAGTTIPADAQATSFFIRKYSDGQSDDVADNGWFLIQIDGDDVEKNFDNTAGRNNQHFLNLAGGNVNNPSYSKWGANKDSWFRLVDPDFASTAYEWFDFPQWNYYHFANFDPDNDDTRLLFRFNRQASAYMNRGGSITSGSGIKLDAPEDVYLTACPDTAYLVNYLGDTVRYNVTDGTGMAMRLQKLNIDDDTPENIDQLRRQIWHISGWDEGTRQITITNEKGQQMVLADVACGSLPSELVNSRNKIKRTFMTYPYNAIPSTGDPVSTMSFTPNKGSEAMKKGEVYNLGVNIVIPEVPATDSTEYVPAQQEKNFYNAWGGVYENGFVGPYNVETDNNNGICLDVVSEKIGRTILRAINSVNQADTFYQQYLNDVVTGVRTIKANTVSKADGKVYTLDGQLVKSNAKNLIGLPKGIYIFNGHKVVR